MSKLKELIRKLFYIKSKPEIDKNPLCLGYLYDRNSKTCLKCPWEFQCRAKYFRRK